MEEKFNKACDFLPSLVKKLDSSMLLKFYSFYKQASVGPCNIEKPSWYSMEAKSKYNAWKNLGEMTKPEAMSKYIDLLSEIMPGWEEQEDKEINWDETEDSKIKTAEHDGHHTKGWVNVSSMMQVEPHLRIEDKNIFEWAKEGNLIMMTKELEKFEYFDINVLDENGLNCLHWACDRGHLDVVKYLIEDCGADVNYKDSEGDSGLDYATVIENADLIEYLKLAGSKKNS